jgi:hypothetical protein
MAEAAKPGLLTRLRRGTCALLVVCLPGCWTLSAQTRLTLQQAGSRNQAPDFAPARVGDNVILRGVVNAPAIRFAVPPEYKLLAIEDGDYGAVLKVTGSGTSLDAFQPGDDIEVRGVVEAFQGMPVIVPSQIELKGRRAPPAPIAVSSAALESHRYLGRLVRTEFEVLESSDAPNGPWIGSPGLLGIFIPRQDISVRQLGLQTGDTVQAAGIAYQHCPQAPFNRGYQLLVSHPSALVKTGSASAIPPVALASLIGFVLLLSFLAWGRERRLRLQRERQRKTYQLGEEVLGSSSAESILKRLRDSLPRILGISRVHLYVLNRTNRTLEAVAAEDRDASSISLSSPPDGTQSGAVACFHYRTLLMIPDIERSPFPIAGQGEGLAKSLLFVPMHAQGDVVGVIELDQDDRLRDFTSDEQELAQHLGNQTGAALRLLEQRSVQEQLYRSEKAAAVGRLITGVVNELQTPLSSISDLAGRVLEKSHGGAAERSHAWLRSRPQIMKRASSR